jgi:hypothetical protein
MKTLNLIGLFAALTLFPFSIWAYIYQAVTATEGIALTLFCTAAAFLFAHLATKE